MIRLHIASTFGEGDAFRACGFPRVECLREGFWLGVATCMAASPPFHLIAQNMRAVTLICPLDCARAPAPPPNTRCVVLSSRGTGDLSVPPGGGSIILAMDVRLLRHILGADFDSLPAAALAVATGSPSHCQDVRVMRSAEHILAASAIRDCTHTGAVRNVYLKSKALELFALSFSALKRQECPIRSHVMPQRDTARMMQAKEILLSRLEDPPGLTELAALVGVCETRLKIGFKHVFGDTPFVFLRKHRMTLARELLLRGESSVSDAASTIGYTNVSHFIDAFVRQYGVRPGELVRAARDYRIPEESRVANE
ncbi:MAG: helix-turn-helix transcriptional regulator [Rhodospirillaceae bacterium]|nr:helix-turn-helix transcriptional regulator [Rhodospirillaceae bacterium]